MPLKRARALMRWGISLDPTTGLLFLVAWCILNSATYLGPGDTFATSRVYATLIAWGVNETYLGAAQACDALLLLTCFRTNSELFRVTVAMLSALLWSAFGAGMLIGAGHLGFLSSVGAFSVLCGFGAGISMSQWAMQEIEP